jgi:monofunctional biosynthetic peptidoglycan transglycosylase
MNARRALRILGSCGCAAALAAAACLGWWFTPGQDLGEWREGPPGHLWAAALRQETLWREEGTRRRIENVYVPLPAISVDLQLAVLVSEDIDFFGHGPIDLDAVWEALQEGSKPGARLRGASTISHQLAKTLFLSGERSVWRKVKEIHLAWWLERKLGKRRVLELYLNVVEFGPGVYGAEAAAQHYYGVSSDGIGPEQASALVAAIPSPGRDNPSTASRRWELRRATIARRMANAGWLRGRLETLSAGRI